MFDPQAILEASGPWALLVVCGIVFVETGLLIGFVLPGDTLLFITGVLTATGALSVPVPLAIAAIALAAVLGDQLGYLIGFRAGPPIFERRQAGLISKATVQRATGFFDRYGPAAVTIARFVPVVRTVAPVAAGVARMPYRRFLVYNAVGGVLWPVLLVGGGALLGRIPGVAAFVEKYLDLVLIGVVAVSAVLVVVNVLRERRHRDAS